MKLLWRLNLWMPVRWMRAYGVGRGFRIWIAYLKAPT